MLDDRVMPEDVGMNVDLEETTVEFNVGNGGTLLVELGTTTVG